MSSKQERVQVIDGSLPNRLRYHLPEDISSHVDFLTPAVTLSAPQKKLNAKRSDQSIWERSPNAIAGPPAPPHIPPAASHLPKDLRNCSNEMTPTCIRALYDIPSPKELASGYQRGGRGNSAGVFEVGGTYSQSDLDTFFKRFTPEM